MSKKTETIYVIRTTRVPLTLSEMEARKNELPLVIAQEDRLALRRKDVLAELKAEAEDLALLVGQIVQEINTGERVEDLRCPKTPVLSERAWHIIHPITGEVLERIPMQWGEVEKLSQTTIPEDEGAPQEPIVPEYSPLLALPAPPPVGEDLPPLEGVIVEETPLSEAPESANEKSERLSLFEAGKPQSALETASDFAGKLI
jgi:hypothetical protein